MSGTPGTPGTAGRVAVIGEGVAVAGYALAGAVVLDAEDRATARERWSGLEDDVVVVVLSPSAAAALAEERAAPGAPLSVVMPT